MKQQFLIPPADTLYCEECFKRLDVELAEKSKRRCDGRLLCFSHQMFYTSRKYRYKRMANKTSNRSVSQAA